MYITFFFEDIYNPKTTDQKAIQKYKEDKITIKKKKVIIIQAGSHIYFKLIVPCVHKINNILIHHQ
jgi:hypothetical protein